MIKFKCPDSWPTDTDQEVYSSMDLKSYKIRKLMVTCMEWECGIDGKR